MLSKEDFTDIFKAHHGAIRNYIFYRCGDIEMASDIAQDVFLRLWERQYSLNSNNMKTVLYKIAMSCYLNDQRKRENRTDFEKSIITEDESSPEDEMVFSELISSYAKALEEMPEKQRAIFLMNREDGMKYSEIADRLNVSVKLVEKHISAALRYLRIKLK
jgi:RNA polymerase sigma-70 factor (ECF subfamily)